MILEPGEYSFVASSGTVTLIGMNVPMEQVALITNISREQVIYNPSVSGYGFVSHTPGANTVIDLEYDTSGFANSDKLQIRLCVDQVGHVIIDSLPEVEVKNDIDNPLPVNVTNAITATLNSIVSIPISATNFNLNAGAFNVASNILTDYELDSIRFSFSTSASRTITITDAVDGTPIFTRTSTALNMTIEEIDQKFPANHNFRIQVSSTASACLMTVEAFAFVGGTVPPSGSNVSVVALPSTPSGTNTIGAVNIEGTEFFSGATNYKAKITSDGELATTVTERERNVLSVYQAATIASNKYAILIDLSDTTNFKHTGTARIDLSILRIAASRNTFNGVIRVGVITAINGTSASISYFRNAFYDSSVSNSSYDEVNFSPSQLKCGVSAGTLTRMITNVSETGVTAVNTGLTLDSPRGVNTVTPAVGDIIVKFERTSGSMDFASIAAFFHGENTV
jgi:hypothetical protein